MTARSEVALATLDLDGLALAAAHAGARAIIAVVSGGRLVVEFPGGASQSPVTSADRASEHAIRALVAAHRADDAVLAEESGATPGTSGLRWIIDPLDGTVNFSRGLDRYAVSIAVEQQPVAPAPAGPPPGATQAGAQPVDALPAGLGRIVAAVILQPATGDWLALRATGVAGNAPRIGVRPAAPSQALLAFAVPNEPEPRRSAYRILTDLAPRVQDLRNFGSSVCDLAAVACGQLDGFITVNPAPWDIAAGLAIVRAAGGSSHRWRGPDGLEVVVAGGRAVVDAVNEWIGA